MLQKEQRAVTTPGDSQGYATCAFSRSITLFLIVSASILCPLVIWLFAWLAFHLKPRYFIPVVVIGPGQGPMVLAWLGAIIITLILLSFGLMILHECCHGLAFRWAGVTPRYGAKMLHKIVPIFYVAAPGFRTPCRKFRVILLAPTLIVNLLGILAMWPPTLLRYLLVFPLGIHLSGCLGDWWMLAVLKATPADSLVEDTPAGFRYQSSPNP